LGRPIVTTTEAPQLRRVVAQQQKQRAEAPMPARRAATHQAGIRDGNGIMFVSHTGEICPSGFLELPAGNVRSEDAIEVYRSSALFKELRQPDLFDGRCGRCEYRSACGGSRARAWAASGSPLGEDPLCVYQPLAS
jgi:radical SAM protein with 4Fe4S-binding SPASM domain